MAADAAPTSACRDRKAPGRSRSRGSSPRIGQQRCGYAAAVSSSPSLEPLLDVTDVVRRVVGARVRDPHLREDLTQETLVRVAAVARRLDGDAVQAYAIVTARNLI